MIKALGAATIAAGLLLAAPAFAANSYATFSFSGDNPVTITLDGVTTLTASNTGWYTDAGQHDATNPNYIAGVCGSDDFCNGDNTIRNDYFVFDLSGVVSPVSTAVISIYQNPLPEGGYISSADHITYTNYDVSTNYLDLIASHDTASDIYSDLGSGTQYAQTIISNQSDGTYIQVTLDAAALSAINSNLGATFAIGGSVDQAVNPPPVSGAPEPGVWALMLGGIGMLGGMLRVVQARRREDELSSTAA